MSYTHCTSTASCGVADDFNLDAYVKQTAKLIFEHYDSMPGDIRGAYLDFDNEEIEKDLNHYLHMNGSKLLIEFDSEESNGDTGVWDWLCDQIRQDVMTSNAMQINHSSYDSRDGVEVGNSYLLKNGTFIGSDDVADLIEKHIQSIL